MRTEPPVSVPTASGTRPRASATAEPEDDPPGTQSGFRAFAGVPKWGFNPRPENASSLSWLLPTTTAPARSRFCTATASTVAGARKRASTADPAAVTVPATSSRSLTRRGTPSRGPSGRPAA